MYINYLAVSLATIAQFIIGAIWYSAIFGKAWAKIHHCDGLSKEEMAKKMKGVQWLYLIQLFLTFITTLILALFRNGLPAEWNIYGEAIFFWIGFIVPSQVSAVIFGETEKKWMVKKISIMAGCSLVCMLTAAGVLSYLE